MGEAGSGRAGGGGYRKTCYGEIDATRVNQATGHESVRGGCIKQRFFSYFFGHPIAKYAPSMRVTRRYEAPITLCFLP